jgi:hypothetical protein
MPDLIRMRSKGAQVHDRIEAERYLRFDRRGRITAAAHSGEPFLQSGEDHECQGNMIGALAIQGCEKTVS